MRLPPQLSPQTDVDEIRSHEVPLVSDTLYEDEQDRMHRLESGGHISARFPVADPLGGH